VLAWAGLWSYSLYLVHAQAADLWYALGVRNLGPRLNWCGIILGSLVGAYALYLVVERPSHRLARWIGAARARRSGAVSGGAELEASGISDATGASAGAANAPTI